jgi:hypothetical protein
MKTLHSPCSNFQTALSAQSERASWSEGERKHDSLTRSTRRRLISICAPAATFSAHSAYFEFVRRAHCTCIYTFYECDTQPRARIIRTSKTTFRMRFCARRVESRVIDAVCIKLKRAQGEPTNKGTLFFRIIFQLLSHDVAPIVLVFVLSSIFTPVTHAFPLEHSFRPHGISSHHSI